MKQVYEAIFVNICDLIDNLELTFLTQFLCLHSICCEETMFISLDEYCKYYNPWKRQNLFFTTMYIHQDVTRFVLPLYAESTIEVTTIELQLNTKGWFSLGNRNNTTIVMEFNIIIFIEISGKGHWILSIDINPLYRLFCLLFFNETFILIMPSLFFLSYYFLYCSSL